MSKTESEPRRRKKHTHTKTVASRKIDYSKRETNGNRVNNEIHCEKTEKNSLQSNGKHTGKTIKKIDTVDAC